MINEILKFCIIVLPLTKLINSFTVFYSNFDLKTISISFFLDSTLPE